MRPALAADLVQRQVAAKFGRFDWDEWKTYRDEGHQ
jgi:hypothetical protein